MGWSYGWSTRQELRQLLDTLSPSYRLLGGAWKGSIYWQAIERVEDGVKFIACNLTAKDRRGGYGYKGMTEDMGPYYYDVPASILALAPDAPPSDGACEWRAKVQEYKARASTRPTPAPGGIVRYMGDLYRFDESLGRRGWRVTRLKDGARQRMPAAYLKHCTINEGQS